MPTLFRLFFVAAATWAVGFGVIFAVAHLAAPVPRTIVQAVALPPGVAEIRTGRSAAAMLDRQAAALVHHRRRSR